MSHLRLSLLGPFQAFLEGEAITGFESNKVRALLAYLAAEAERPARRAVLADLLWPDWPEKSAMRNLTFALVDLRKNIADRLAQPPFLLINRDGLQLNPASQIQVDLWDFTRLVKTAVQIRGDRSAYTRQLRSTIDLYRGPFLEGFSLADSSPYEEWLAAARQQVNRQMVEVLGELTEAYLEQGEYEQGMPYARRRVELEPWLEEGHQQLMRLLALSGQRSLALAQYEVCRKALKDEFGVEPGAETAAIFDQIRTGNLARPVTTAEPQINSADHKRPKHNLPVELTRFFDREADILKVKERLSEWRLVTLTGSGGVGKTRLAQRVAGEVLDDYNNGVWLVELASTSDPELIAQRVAASLGLKEEAQQPILERLQGFLCSRTTLLVLDNCEHLLEACARLADVLLHACPHLKILATSREPLGVAGEAIFRVPSLPFPARDQTITPETIDAYAAVRLFTDRAGGVLPGYAVNDQNAGAVASICQRLDGIPLAIELAAARMSVLSAEELFVRLDNVFRLLAGGSRAALPRQQTLRATIDWSFKLLNDQEIRLLRRLAVFTGGWDLAGAEGVCSGEGLEADDILDLLASLVNKSMVNVSHTNLGRTRYHMLETIRQYAREKLIDCGEMENFQHRHLAYFAELAESVEPQARGPHQREWRRRLEDDIENIRLALGVGLKEDPPAGLRLASALWQFWEIIGRNMEGSQWLRTYLNHPENAGRTALRGHALWRLSRLNHSNLEAEDAAQSSLEIFRGLNDVTGQGCALLSWGGYKLASLEDSKSAREHFKAALVFFEESQDHWWLATTLFFFSGLARYEGDVTAHFAYLEKALSQFRKIGDQNLIASVLVEFGSSAAIYNGDFINGYAMLVEAQAIYRQIDFNDWNVQIPLSEVLSWQGEFKRANQALEENQEFGRQAGDDTAVQVTNLSAGGFICLQGRLEEGIALMERAVWNMKESGALNTNQTSLMELAYAHACLGEIEKGESLVREYEHLFRDVQYQPRLKRLLGFLALKKGAAEESAKFYCEGLSVAVQMQWRLDALLALEGYAWALQLNAQTVEAVRLLSAAAEFRGRIGAQVFPRDRPVYDQVIAALQDNLGEEGYSAAWVEGQALGFERACSLD